MFSSLCLFLSRGKTKHRAGTRAYTVSGETRDGPSNRRIFLAYFPEKGYTGLAVWTLSIV